MKNTVTQSEFTAAFHRMGRGDSFSHSGLCALFDYLCEMEEDCGTEIELDVIALACEYAEYSDFRDFRDGYFGDDHMTARELHVDMDEADDDELDDATREYILDHGQLIEFDDGIIVSQF